MRPPFKARSHEEKKELVKAMVIRMAEAYGIEKKALPEFLGCTKAVVNNWSYYGRIPFHYLESCSAKTGVSMDWLLYGQLAKQCLSPDDAKLLIDMHQQALKDGLDYGLIKESHKGSVLMLMNKFAKDIKRMILPPLAKSKTGS